jgi:hypothetical protein
MCWIYRLQVSEVGIHRPHVAGLISLFTAKLEAKKKYWPKASHGNLFTWNSSTYLFLKYFGFYADSDPDPDFDILLKKLG